MLVQSYRHYLDSLEKKADSGLIGKILLIIGILMLVTVGITSSFIYYESKKEAPIRTQAKYLENINNTLTAANQSISEILSSFQVAGAKVQIIDDLRESSASASGFFVSLDDLERSSSKLELTINNLESQKTNLQKNSIPENFTDTNTQTISFLANTQRTLDGINTEQSFIKNMLYASGPNFYLPVLTDETIWKEGNKDAVVAYYQDAKTQADETLKNLSKLTPPDVFESYFDTQNAYLILLVNTADGIINTLSQKDNPNIDEATQMEKAYQKLISAKKENEKLSEALLTEKTKVFDFSRNQQKFAQIKLDQKFLMDAIEHQYLALPPTKIDKLPLPSIIKTFFTN